MANDPTDCCNWKLLHAPINKGSHGDWSWKNWEGARTPPPFPPFPTSSILFPQMPRGGFTASQGLRSRRPERPPYLVAEARPGREGAWACGRHGPLAHSRPARAGFPEAASESLRPRATRSQRSRERNNEGRAREAAAPAIIHNPADRKEWVTSLPTVAQPIRSPVDPAAGTFVFPLSEPAAAGSGSWGHRELTGQRGGAVSCYQLTGSQSTLGGSRLLRGARWECSSVRS